MDNTFASDQFKKLLEIADALLGPTGCLWDKEQTLVSMRSSILEEACEVIEAVDEENDIDLIEELGDLLYNIIFFCKLAEKEKRFAAADPIQNICQKLIQRHPHVFTEKKIEDIDQIMNQWEQIKKIEKAHRESLMDGIPKGLPALARAYKISGKMKKAYYGEETGEVLFDSEEALGELLWEVVTQARKQQLNPETALRKEMVNQEKAFRLWENEKKSANA